MLKKVVLFANGLPDAGGAARLMMEEADFFRRRGVETKLLLFKLNPKALFGHKELDVEIIGASGTVSRVRALRKRLKEINPDLIICDSFWSSYYLYFATMFTGIPYVSHVHATFFWFYDEPYPLKYALLHRRVFDEIRNSVPGHREFITKNPGLGMWKKLKLNALALMDYLSIRKARKVFVLSNHMKWEFGRIYKKDAVAVRGCLKPEIFSYRPKKNIKKSLGIMGKKMILNVNVLHKRKRVDLLIRAFAKLRKMRDDVFLVIGGSGDQEHRLRSLVKGLNLDNDVKFVGYIKDGELWDYYCSSDVFVHPNWAEFAISPFEVLGLGKKVIWTTEMENDKGFLDKNQLFVTEPDVDSLTKTMNRALNTKMTGRIDMSRYTWDRYFTKIYEACEDALKTK